jgi:hypothetical protein
MGMPTSRGSTFRRSRCASLSAWLLASLAGCDDPDECPDRGAKWCRGQEILWCDEEDSHLPSGLFRDTVNNIVVVSEECGNDDQEQCIEQGGDAYCGYPAVVCQGPGTVCVGTRLATCISYFQHPFLTQRCDADEQACMVGISGSAACSFIAERCDTRSKERRCSHKQVLICTDGIWLEDRFAPDVLVAQCAAAEAPGHDGGAPDAGSSDAGSSDAGEPEMDAGR